jgi:hypothetical protein
MRRTGTLAAHGHESSDVYTRPFEPVALSSPWPFRARGPFEPVARTAHEREPASGGEVDVLLTYEESGQPRQEQVPRPCTAQ